MYCIQEVPSYLFAGKLYRNEIDAVKAALTEIGERIVREHHSNPINGLLAHGEDISFLRSRYLHLTSPAPTAVVEAPASITGEPKGGNHG